MDPDQLLARFPAAGFDGLRPLQRDALVKIHGTHAADSDLALEMPTGSGKTLVGLLLAAEAMAAGRSAVYLTGTIQLSHQVIGEANRLGLDADLISAPLHAVSAMRIHRIESGRRLAVLNYWAYFSERRLFSPPGILVVDDAHLLEGALESRYGISITARDKPELLEAIYDVISRRFPGYQVVDDYVLKSPHPSEVQQLIAFPHVWELADAINEVLANAALDDDSIRFPYQRLSPRIRHCLWLAGPREFLIRPLRYPLHAEDRFTGADQRVFMSATMGDLGDLRRRLGSAAITRVALDPALSRETGVRYLVVADTPETAEELVAARPQLREATPRRVWFCRSKHEAEEVAASLAGGGEQFALDRDGAVIEQFAQSANADLVIGGRFDGIDFSDNIARLAIFPSAPFGVDPFEEFLTAHFGRATYLQARVAERVTQALGRMTRGDDDWAVVVLEDPKLAHKLVQREVATRLPRRLWAEIQAGLERAEEDTDAALATAVAVLAGAELPRPEDEPEPTGGQIGDWSDAWVDLESRFGDALHAGTFDAAIPAAERLIEAIGDHPLRPWWLYLVAMAQFLSASQDRRQDRMRDSLSRLQASVRSAGPTAWFARVEASCSVVKANVVEATHGGRDIPTRLEAFLSEFRSARQFEAWCTAVVDGLASEAHAGVVAAWTDVGRALGYRTSRPSGDGSTDSLWRHDGLSLVFEAKIEHAPGSTIDRANVNQLLGQIEDEARSGASVIGCFVTTMDQYHPAAEQTARNLAALPVTVCMELWQRLRPRVSEARSAWEARHEVSPDPVLDDPWLASLLDRCRGRFASVEDLDAVWPSRRRR